MANRKVSLLHEFKNASILAKNSRGTISYNAMQDLHVLEHKAEKRTVLVNLVPSYQFQNFFHHILIVNSVSVKPEAVGRVLAVNQKLDVISEKVTNFVTRVPWLP